MMTNSSVEEEFEVIQELIKDAKSKFYNEPMVYNPSAPLIRRAIRKLENLHDEAIWRRAKEVYYQSDKEIES